MNGMISLVVFLSFQAKTNGDNYEIMKIPCFIPVKQVRMFLWRKKKREEAPAVEVCDPPSTIEVETDNVSRVFSYG